MSTSRFAALLGTVALVILACLWPRQSVVAQTTPAASEYLTIRWDGRDSTHVIRPGGKVEFLGAELRKVTRPSGCDDRTFYLNVAMNGLVKEGWEFAGMTTDEIVMRRLLGR